MAAREFFRVNTGPQDGSLFSMGYANSMFRHEPHHTFSDRVREPIEIVVENPGFNVEKTIEVEKLGSMAEDHEVEFDLSAITPGLGATFFRFVNWLGYRLISEYSLRYAGNQIVTHFPEKLYIEHKLKHSSETQAVMDSLVAGNLTIAQRNALALGTQRIRVPLPTPWRYLRGHSLLIAALSNKMRHSIKIPTLASLIQTDAAGATATMNRMAMHVEIIHATGPERAETTAITLRPTGMNYLFADNRYHRQELIPAGTTVANIKLTNFDSPSWLVAAFLQQQTLVDDPNNQFLDIDPTYLNLIDTYQIRGGSSDLLKPTRASTGLQYLHKKFFPGIPFNHGLLLAPLSEYPNIDNCASGSYNFANISNPQFIITFFAPLANPMYIWITSFDHNWTNHQGGDYQKIWH